jgi:hypothetical protein
MSLRPSVCPSVCTVKHGSGWKNSLEIVQWAILLKSVKNIQVWLKEAKTVNPWYEVKHELKFTSLSSFNVAVVDTD